MAELTQGIVGTLRARLEEGDHHEKLIEIFYRLTGEWAAEGGDRGRPAEERDGERERAREKKGPKLPGKRGRKEKVDERTHRDSKVCIHTLSLTFHFLLSPSTSHILWHRPSPPSAK